MVDAFVERFGIENLRGFKRVWCDTTQQAKFLVGPNNAGKTSLLRILNWSMNQADAELLTGARDLTDIEARLLHPATETAGRARRITMEIRISDLRVARGFKARNGVAQLRLKVNQRRVTAHLGPARRGEPMASETGGGTASTGGNASSGYTYRMSETHLLEPFARNCGPS